MTPQSNVHSELYSLAIFRAVDNPYYLLVHETGDMQVTLLTDATEPSPVPAPRSALHLSSGVMGLAGCVVIADAPK